MKIHPHVRDRFTAAGFAVVASGSLLLALISEAVAAPPTMGVYLGSDEATVARYEDYTQQSMSPLISFGPMDNWEALTGRYVSNNQLRSPPYGLGWAVGQWDAAYKSRVVWSIPMLPQSGATLAAGAAGSYDQQWKNVARTLIDAGYGNNTLRIGWEFMGNWFVWGVAGTGSNGVANTTNFKNYWKRIVLAMRSEPGANFKFNWCGSPGDYYSGPTLMNPADCYPDADAGGSYVDEIGIDVYDTCWSKDANDVYLYPIDPAWPQWRKDSNRTNAWLSVSSWGTYHMNWWASFAATKGKPMTVPEWGLAESASQHGGGDNAIFMQKFHEWLIKPANNVKWHAYFQDDVSFISKFFEDNPAVFPNATTKFLQLYMGRPLYIVFQNPVSNVAWTGGYGTRSITSVGTDAGHAPFEGANHYKITYTTNAGIQLAFNEQNLSAATHLSLATKGPLTNSSQTLMVRLFASDGTYGPAVTIPRTTSYDVTDIAMSSLIGTTLNVTKVNSIYFYATTAPVGTSDTIYLDSVVFLKTTP